MLGVPVPASEHRIIVSRKMTLISFDGCVSRLLWKKEAFGFAEPPLLDRAHRIPIPNPRQGTQQEPTTPGRGKSTHTKPHQEEQPPAVPPITLPEIPRPSSHLQSPLDQHKHWCESKRGPCHAETQLFADSRVDHPNPKALSVSDVFILREEEIGAKLQIQLGSSSPSGLLLSTLTTIQRKPRLGTPEEIPKDARGGIPTEQEQSGRSWPAKRRELTASNRF
ncbi:hypothetical protein CRENBAI_020534 [Crenichthys baileyi]|uniref:Uncharacterized protein n=1 Tax=Crenichthys baileyi TaxID=28760 RepID=A0AAV9R0J0_9TELE